ncbi:MAG: TetM/TetW/TetO/TetS family tetracycline resistance ribosomal protection protein [Lachnospiraceae bacterium]|nr:TetM/TetW/TetO/TetS family tetracycline resistance ribosomal protection protein [Candidatus Darwinimomas equi]
MITIGILAHVDAGKTTLSENILFDTGSIRRAGRVDSGDTCLDTHDIERARGITIFSSSASFSVSGRQFTLLDTPGHTDFSAEMERTLSVLDYAILVVSAPEGIQGHTLTLFRLLERYQLPVFIFVNKMDRYAQPREEIMNMLSSGLSGDCVNFSDMDYEGIAGCDEKMMEDYLSTGRISEEDIIRTIAERKLYPVFFGSALRNEGVSELLAGMAKYMSNIEYGDEFAARVYKITHDDKHNRLTHMKIVGGSLKVRDRIGDDKVSTIQEGNEIFAGELCTVAGLSGTYPGQGINCEDAPVPAIEPVMTYRVVINDNTSPIVLMDNLDEIGEENPELRFSRDENSREIHVMVMGLIQLEILKEIVKERFGTDISFDAGTIVYKETLSGMAYGVGHFEPLRHYAEVHLVMTPGKRGSGITVSSDVSEDVLAKNWQRLIITHVLERKHAGVLTGAELTDVEITVKGGRAHVKHTEGGDFRQATYRAIREGLMEAMAEGKTELLEPYYNFIMTMPQEYVGRAMNDIEAMKGKCLAPELMNDTATLYGYAPVSELWDYPNELNAYTRGFGSISMNLKGYDLCHNQDEVLGNSSYDPEADLRNPSGSVFCSHGAGVYVPWNEVKSMMHVESVLGTERDITGAPVTAVRTATVDEWISSEEVDAILKQANGSNKKNKVARRAKKVYTYENSNSVNHSKPHVIKPEYMLVDGYNIIFAWPELKQMAEVNVDSARLKLLDIISNFAGFKDIETAVVFDAYRLEHHKTELLDYHNIHVVFTATAETADHYIESFTHQNASKYAITVAASDGIEQIIIRSQECRLLTASGLLEEVRTVNEQIKEIINGSL